MTTQNFQITHKRFTALVRVLSNERPAAHPRLFDTIKYKTETMLLKQINTKHHYEIADVRPSNSPAPLSKDHFAMTNPKGSKKLLHSRPGLNANFTRFPESVLPAGYYGATRDRRANFQQQDGLLTKAIRETDLQTTNKRLNDR